MNKLKKLASILYNKNLKSEAAEVLKLKSAEHPDWKDEWEEPKDYDPAEVVPSGIKSFGEGSAESKMNEILKNFGITIITDKNEEPLGMGGHGYVYRCIYNGKPAVVKIQFYRKEDYRPYAQDVNNWKKLMNIWNSVPDFVRKHIPKVFLAESGEFYLDAKGFSLYYGKHLFGNHPYDPDDESEYEFEYQIMVMEELYPLPGGLGYSIEGSSRNTPWLWEEELDNFYQKIWSEFLKVRAVPPDRGDFSRAIKSTNDSRNYVPMIEKIRKIVADKINSQFSTFDSEGQQLFQSIDSMLKALSESFEKSIPRWGDDPPPSNYIPRDVQGLWKAIDWLRNNGMNADDITSDNVMIDSNGTLKIADLGSL